MERQNLLKQLKQDRGYRKATLTRKCNDIRNLISDFDNVNTVKEKIKELNQAIVTFKDAHRLYHTALDVDEDIQASQVYLQQVNEDLNSVQLDIQTYIDATASYLTPVRSEPAPPSRTASHLSSTRAKVSARRAALEIEAAALDQEKQLEQEELQIRQKKRELLLKTELAKADAEEKVYSEVAEERSQLSGGSFRGKTSRILRWKDDVDEHLLHTSDQHNPSPRMNTHSSYPRVPLESNLNPAAVPFHSEQNNNDMPQVHKSWSPHSFGESTSNEKILQLIQDGQQQQQEMLNIIQLPRAELVSFDGDPLKYWMFIRSFENNVEKVNVENDNARLMRLMQYCTGKARKVIQCCSVMQPALGYLKAKSLLRERFGNNYVIAESWIEKITEGPRIKSTDHGALQDFADDLQNCRETLNAMGRLHEISNQKSLVKIIERLPMYLLGRWKREAHKIQRKSDRIHLDDVITYICDAAEEANDPVFGKITDRDKEASKTKSNKKSSKQGNFQYNFNTTSEPVTNDKHDDLDKNKMAAKTSTNSLANPSSAQKPTRKCPMCSANHTLFACENFKKLTPEDRFKFVRETKLCYNCFIPGHMASKCMRDTTCTIRGCGRKHATLLHFQQKPNVAQKNEQLQEKAQTETNSTSCNVTGASFENRHTTSRVSLPIVPVLVKSPSGEHIIGTYAMLDNCSSNSFCTAELMTSLQLTGHEEHLTLTTLGKEQSKDVSVVSLTVSDINGENVMDLPRVYSGCMLPINMDLPQPEDLEKWSHLQDIGLSFINNGKVTLLIGQDAPSALMPLEVRRATSHDKDQAPYAVKTLLGWTINGPLHVCRLDHHKVSANFINCDQRLEKQVEDFWKLEGNELLHDDKPAMSVNDKRVIDIWNKSIQMTEGCYMMDIPLKTRPAEMPNNRYIAANRLSLLGKRLEKDHELHKKYVHGIDDLIKKGYAEKIPVEEISNNDDKTGIWYLPHHPVINDKKPEKIRIVYDCAAKFLGKSLNDYVLKGPDLMNNLVSVLLRFRQHQTAIMADIESMFHRVKVTPKDRDMLRFLWWPNGDTSQRPDEYRMTAHIFGGVWSPSCANFALHQTATDNCAQFDPETVMTIMNNFYVDDCLKSCESKEEAIRLSNQLYRLLDKGGFRLTKWISNNRNVLMTIPENERAKEVKDLDQINDTLPIERALGISWDIEVDQFKFKTMMKDKPLTKRGMLSIVSSVFDPLGFVSPYILSAKLILQKLCRLKVDWDARIPDTELTSYLKWLTDLHKMEQFKIDRCLKPQASSDIRVCQLHHFSDASQSAYGTVCYLRILDNDGNIHCSFVMSKSHLAPLKAVTIPRLELAAAALSVKVDKMLRTSLDIVLGDSVFWTDSTIVLQYIENTDKRFNTFVANRVQAIHDVSSSNQWHYVNSELNPADCASRGLNADDLISKSTWRHGPDFLWQSPDNWPQRPVTSCHTDLIPTEEIKKESQVYTTTADPKIDLLDRICNKYSSWTSLKKTVAWILRLKHNLLSRIRKDTCPISGSLSVKEMKCAEQAIVKHIQAGHFSEEIHQLSADVALTKSHLKRSSPLYQLEPILSPQGILCVGGRLAHAPISEETKHPMIIPKNHHVVNLIIEHYHHQSGHSGTEHVLALIRQRYWLIHGKSVVKKALRQCYSCKRRKAIPGKQRMADLPQDRITPDKPPFSFVGVDYFGPFIVRRGRTNVKRYGCIYTCLVLRAVHIEIAFSLDTTSFINTLQRFISRRGTPIQIRSDNGTNLVAGNKELRSAINEWNQSQIEEFLKQREIQWKFNPPTASHMGGAWERQIRTIRKVMEAVLNQQTLDDEALVTYMCLIEGIINSRPLTALSDDIHDAEPLTPNHLLLLRAGAKLPPGLFVKEDLYIKRRWRQVQYLADQFWRRWLKEYLPNLQQRRKWLQPERNFQEGDIVLLTDMNTPRNMWPIARVVTTFPGQDGKVRTVQVKTQNSNFIRPVTKLCLLEETMEQVYYSID